MFQPSHQNVIIQSLENPGDPEHDRGDEETLGTYSLGGPGPLVPLVSTSVPLRGVRKTISFFGGLCLLFNNITGPGMVQLQLIFSEAGWVLATAFLLGTGLVTLASSVLLVEAMARVPGNSRFNWHPPLDGSTDESR
eukprot:RCo022134